MKTVTKIVAPALAAGLLAGVAAPASAAVYDRPGELRRDISQLDNRIDRAEARRTISKREAAQLERQVDRLEQTWRAYARGGFTRYELASLERGVDSIERQLVSERRDDNRWGNDRYRR